jgi:hypothetical protein
MIEGKTDYNIAQNMRINNLDYSVEAIKEIRFLAQIELLRNMQKAIDEADVDYYDSENLEYKTKEITKLYKRNNKII